MNNIKCKRYLNQIKIKTIGNQRYFLDQFSDKSNIWHTSKMVLNYDYFGKNYQLTQEQAYDLIMNKESHICPICKKNKRTFINYFSGYKDTCNDNDCLENKTILYRFISSLNQIVELSDSTKKKFAEYINSRTDLICPKCNTHDGFKFHRDWHGIVQSEVIENNRQVRIFDATNWICYNCKHSIVSHDHMMKLHYGTSKRDKKFQKTIRDKDHHYKFSEEDLIKGGLSQIGRLLEYSKSDLGRKISSDTLINTWKENYDYMVNCLKDRLDNEKYLYNVTNSLYKNFSEIIAEEDFNDKLEKLLEYANCNKTILLQSWANLIKEWLHDKVIINHKTYIYYAKIKNDDNSYKIGITNNPNRRYSKKSEYFDLQIIKEFKNRFSSSYVEYKLRTLFCFDKELIYKKDLDKVIHYVNNIKYDDKMKQELTLLGWKF